MQELLDGIQAIYDFITSGIYEFWKEATVYLVKTAILFWIDVQIKSLEFAITIARGVLDSLNVSGHIQLAITSAPSELQQYLYFFRIPECINIILTGFVGRFVLKYVPFI